MSKVRLTGSTSGYTEIQASAVAGDNTLSLPTTTDGTLLAADSSGNPSVVGDAAWNHWTGKYLRDEYGAYLLDANGDRQLNPNYDPDQPYVPREDRPEWSCVGLMGKLRIRKGQPTGTRWIKMRDISATVEEWLVR